MSKLTIVWNNHGDGKLVGAFNDPELITKLRNLIISKNQENYIRFIEVELNNINNKNLKPDINFL